MTELLEYGKYGIAASHDIMKSSDKRLGPASRFHKRVPGRNLFFRPDLDNSNIAIVTQYGEQVAAVLYAAVGQVAGQQHLTGP